MKLSVIIPMYNESKIIEQTARNLFSYLNGRFDSYELIFSDDGSTDGCGDLVRNLQLPNVRVTGYKENRGKGCAIRTAMLEAEGDLIVFTDADLAYGTEMIGTVYDFYMEQSKNREVHMILGSRNLHKNGYEEYSRLRKILSKVYIRILCLVGGFHLSDSQCGFKAFRKDIAKTFGQSTLPSPKAARKSASVLGLLRSSFRLARRWWMACFMAFSLWHFPKARILTLIFRSRSRRGCFCSFFP